MNEYPAQDLYAYARGQGNVEDMRSILADARREFTSSVAIVVPAYRDLHPRAAESLAVGQSILRKKFDYCHLRVQDGSLLPDSREELAEISVAARTKFTFWMDADMEVTAEAWCELARFAEESYGEVGRDDWPSIHHRTFWAYGLAYPSAGPVIELAATLPSAPDRLDIERGERVMASGIGLGCAVIPTLAMAMTSSPLFERKWIGRRSRFKGEDLSFCEKLRNENKGGIWLGLNAHGIGHFCEERRDIVWYGTRRFVEEHATVTRKIRDGSGVDPEPPHSKPVLPEEGGEE